MAYYKADLWGAENAIQTSVLGVYVKLAFCKIQVIGVPLQ